MTVRRQGELADLGVLTAGDAHLQEVTHGVVRITAAVSCKNRTPAAASCCNQTVKSVIGQAPASAWRRTGCIRPVDHGDV